MPKVPNDTPQISLNTPSLNAPSSREFGKVGSALENIGGNVANIGIDLATQVNRATAQDASSSVYYQNKLDGEKKIIDLKLKSPDGFMRNDDGSIAQNPSDGSPRTITDEFHSWSDQQFQDSQKAMPNLLAAQMYKSRALPYFSDQMALLENDTQVMKVKAFDQRQDFAVQAFGDSLVTRPDLGTFYSHSNDIKKTMNDQVGVMHNQTDSDQKSRMADEKLGRDIMQGAYTQEILNKKEGDPDRVSSIMKWQSILAGDDAMSKYRESKGLPTLSTMMDPVQKSIEQEKLARLLPGAKKSDGADWKRGFENSIAAAQSGRMNDKDIGGLLIGLHQQVSSGVILPNEGTDLAAKFLASVNHGKLGGPEFGLMPVNQMREVALNSLNYTVKNAHDFAKSIGINPNYSGEISRERLNSESVSLIKNDVEERNKDIAAYMAKPTPNGGYASNAAAQMSLMDWSQPSAMYKSSSTMKQAMQDTVNAARSAQVPFDKITLVPKDNAETLARTFTDPNRNEERVANDFKAFMGSSGRFGPQVIQQMRRDGQLSSGWALMENISPKMNQITMTQMISAVRTPEGTVNVAFDNAMSANKIPKKDFDLEVGKLVSPWASGQEQANPNSLAGHNFQAESVRVIGNLAKQYYIQAPGDGVAVASQKAFDQVVTQFSHIVPNGRDTFWGMENAGIAIIPKSQATDEEGQNIAHNMKKIMTEDGIRSINPFAPTNGIAIPSQFKDNFPGFVAASSPRFTYMVQHGEPGVGIKYHSGNSLTLLMKDANTPYFVPLSQVKTRAPEGPSTVDSLKKFIPGQNTYQPTKQRHTD